MFRLVLGEARAEVEAAAVAVAKLARWLMPVGADERSNEQVSGLERIMKWRLRMQVNLARFKASADADQVHHRRHHRIGTGKGFVLCTLETARAHLGRAAAVARAKESVRGRQR